MEYQKFRNICKSSSHDEDSCWFNKANKNTTRIIGKDFQTLGKMPGHYKNYNNYDKQNYSNSSTVGNGFYHFVPTYHPIPPATSTALQHDK